MQILNKPARVVDIICDGASNGDDQFALWRMLVRHVLTSNQIAIRLTGIGDSMKHQYLCSCTTQAFTAEMCTL